MSDIGFFGSSVTSNLTKIMDAQEIEPGTEAGYELCKVLFKDHPLGGKLIIKPIALATADRRKINCESPLETELVKAFNREWDALGATHIIRDFAHISRIYGAAGLIYGAPKIPTTEPIDPWELQNLDGIYFNVLDPLNMAGSIVTNQDPNAPDFQRQAANITAMGQKYHPSRSLVKFNGTPIYLSYSSSSFSYSGRSVFQSALYPLKSYIKSMQTNDLVSSKAGLIIAKVKQPGSIVNKLMEKATNMKLSLLKSLGTGDVLSIAIEEDISSINLQNIDTAMNAARDNIIADIATAADVPGLLIKDESFTKGFGEGTEDSKAIAQYLDGIREDFEKVFRFFDKIVMHRAWSSAFFDALKNEHPDLLGGLTYEQFFYECEKNFEATWPSLIKEPESDIVNRQAQKVTSMTQVMTALYPMLDPANKARVVRWMAENLNNTKELFSTELQIDEVALAEYEPPQAQASPTAAPGGKGDSE